MRNLWKPSSAFMGGHPAIELRTTALSYTNVEYCLAGPRGMLWEQTIGENGLSKPECTPRYSAVVLNARSRDKGRGERLVRFGADELAHWILELGVPSTSAEQTCFANTFGCKRRPPNTPFPSP